MDSIQTYNVEVPACCVCNEITNEVGSDGARVGVSPDDFDLREIVPQLQENVWNSYSGTCASLNTTSSSIR